jgi:hypothetical protein
MSYWSLYFLLKVGLHYAGYLGFHWPLNLLLAVIVFWPVKHPIWRNARPLVMGIAGAALLYYDSYLPSISRVWEQSSALAGFSIPYMLELLQRLINPWVVAGFVLLVIVYTVLSRRIRFSTFAVLAILSVPLLNGLHYADGELSAATTSVQHTSSNTSSDSSPEAQLRNFYNSEHQRRLSFGKSTASPNNFSASAPNSVLTTVSGPLTNQPQTLSAGQAVDFHAKLTRCFHLKLTHPLA